MITTDTTDHMRKLQDEATEAGHDHGWRHAAFVEAYGGHPYAEPEVPPWFSTVATFCTAGYDDGATAYCDDTADE